MFVWEWFWNIFSSICNRTYSSITFRSIRSLYLHLSKMKTKCIICTCMKCFVMLILAFSIAQKKRKTFHWHIQPHHLKSTTKHYIILYYDEVGFTLFKAFRYLYYTIIYTFSWTMPPLETFHIAKYMYVL